MKVKDGIIKSSTANGGLTAENVNTLMQAGIIPPNTPRQQIMVFAQICAERGLSPFSKEIYLVGYGNKYTPIVGIDGYRKLARLTGEHAGTDDTKYNLLSDGTFKTATDLVVEKQLPISATVTVYRFVNGQKTSYTHTALFSEFAMSGKWKSMPFQMISKVAESFALRKGFNDKLTGLRIVEEMDALQDTANVQILSPKQEEEIAEIHAQIKAELATRETVADCMKYLKANPVWMEDKQILGFFSERRLEIENADNPNFSTKMPIV